MDRPALTRLLPEIEAGLFHLVIDYKSDRSSHSLMDFAKLVQKFEDLSVSFISFTRQFTNWNAEVRTPLREIES